MFLGLMKKTVSSGQVRERKISQLIYNIYPEYNMSSFLVTFCHKYKGIDTKWAHFFIEGSIQIPRQKNRFSNGYIMFYR